MNLLPRSKVGMVAVCHQKEQKGGAHLLKQLLVVVQTWGPSEPSSPKNTETRGSGREIMSTPRRTTASQHQQGSRSSPERSRAAILRDMALRAQPVMMEMEVRKKGWLAQNGQTSQASSDEVPRVEQR